jgi:hypothetical protein
MLRYGVGTGFNVIFGHPQQLYDFDALRPPHTNPTYFNRTFPCASGWKPMAFGAEGVDPSAFIDTSETRWQSQTGTYWYNTLIVNDVSQGTSNDTIELDITVAGAGVDVNLTVNDVAQATTNDAVALTQERDLILVDCAQATSNDAIALTSETSLTLVTSSQTTSDTTIALTQENNLVISDVAQTTSNDGIILEQDVSTLHTLTVNDVAQTTSNDTVAPNTQRDIISVTDCNQTTSDTEIVLTQESTLSVSDAAQATSNDAIVITTPEITLTIQNVAQATSNDAISLPVERTIATVSSCNQTTTDDSVGMSVVVPRPEFEDSETLWQDLADTTWDQDHDKISIADNGMLTITNDAISLSIAAGVQATLVIQDSSQATSDTAISLTQEQTLSISNVVQTTSDTSISLVPEIPQFQDTGYTVWQDLEETTWEKAAVVAGVTTLNIVNPQHTISNDAITLAKEEASISLTIADCNQYIDSRRVVFKDRATMTWDGLVMKWDKEGIDSGNAIYLVQEQTLTLIDILQAQACSDIVLDTAGLVIMNLVVPDVAQTASDDSVAQFTFETNISVVEDALQSISNDAIDTFVLENTLVINDILQTTTNDSIVLDLTGFVTENLAIQDIIQTTSSDEISLTQEQTLVVTDLLQSTTNDAIVILSERNLVVVDTLSTTTNDVIGIWQETFLAISDVAQATANDDIVLDTTGTSTYNLSINDVLQQNTSDVIELMQEILMAMDTAFQTTTNDNITDWTHKNVLSVFDGMDTITDSSMPLPIQMTPFVITDSSQITTNTTVNVYAYFIGLIRNPSFNSISTKYGFGRASTGFTQLSIEDVTDKRQIYQQ